MTLVAADGAYGGPTRVALNQADALQGYSHSVRIAAPSRGLPLENHEYLGVPARFFRARFLPRVGFAGTFSPRFLIWLIRHIRTVDVVHVHLGRDLVSLPTGWIAKVSRVPYVAQTHGMITPKGGGIALRTFDWMFTRPVLRSAGSVLCLNDRETADIAAVEPTSATRVLANGVPAACETDDHVEPADVHRAPEVLFLARMHERKRPDLFGQAARLLLDAGTDAQFTLVGPEEGAEVDVDEIIAEMRARGISSLQRSGPVAPADVTRRMSSADVYVLPAAREPFGMTVVEACSAGLPVVVMADSGLAPFVRENDCGIVVDEATPEALGAAMKRLIDDPQMRRRMGDSGRRAVAQRYGMDAIVRDLEEIYQAMIGTDHSGRKADTRARTAS